MDVSHLFFHLLNFVAPAAFLALTLALGARVALGRACALPWWGAISLNFLLGCLILGLGLVLGGHDGRMVTYALLVAGMGTCQWLLCESAGREG